MTLEELQQQVDKDFKLDDTELDAESIKIPLLHNKYLQHFNKFSLLLKKAEYDYNILKRHKWEYYTGKSDQSVYAEKPFDLKILKADVFARLFSGKVTPGTLAEIEKALPSDPLQATKIILKELVKEAGVEDEEYSGAATSTGTINIGPGKSIEMDLQSSDIAPQVPVEVPTTAIPGSSISSAQVVAPLPTMGGQPQQTNVARAQQAFPFDPIFAAADGGIADKGIMNTSRGRQMVV